MISHETHSANVGHGKKVSKSSNRGGWGFLARLMAIAVGGLLITGSSIYGIVPALYRKEKDVQNQGDQDDVQWKGGIRPSSYSLNSLGVADVTANRFPVSDISQFPSVINDDEQPTSITQYGVDKNNYNTAHDVYPMQDGGFLFVGTTGQFKGGDYDNPINTRCIAGRVRENREIVWSWKIGKVNINHCYSIKPMINSDGDHNNKYFFIVGRFSDGRIEDGIVLLKVEVETGEIVWERGFRADFYQSLDTKSLAIQPTEDGGCTIFGADDDDNDKTDDFFISAVSFDKNGQVNDSRKIYIKNIKGAIQGPIIKEVQSIKDGFVIAGTIAYDEEDKGYHYDNSCFIARWNPKTGKVDFRIFYKVGDIIFEAVNIKPLSEEGGFVLVGTTYANGHEGKGLVFIVDKNLKQVSAETIGAEGYNICINSVDEMQDGRKIAIGDFWKGYIDDKEHSEGYISFIIDEFGRIEKDSIRILKTCENNRSCVSFHNSLHEVKSNGNGTIMVGATSGIGIKGTKIVVAQVDLKNNIKNCSSLEKASQLKVEDGGTVEVVSASIDSTQFSRHARDIAWESTKVNLTTTRICPEPPSTITPTPTEPFVTPTQYPIITPTTTERSSGASQLLSARYAIIGGGIIGLVSLFAAGFCCHKNREQVGASRVQGPFAPLLTKNESGEAAASDHSDDLLVIQ